ncbi:MAG: DNA mismatch repair protein MutS, partial [Lentisphaeria bacterium]
LSEVREILNQVKDLERTISRLNVGNCNARDLISLQRGLSIIPGLKETIAVVDNHSLNMLNNQLVDLTELCDLIETTINPDSPLTIKDGNIILSGYNQLLDELRSASTDGKSWIAKVQSKEQEITNIKNLKIKYNKVFGYFLEVSNSNKDLVPNHWIRKQTLVNCERYITPELKEIEDKILGAEDKSKALETEIFNEIRQKATECTSIILQIAQAIATIDTFACLAKVANDQNYTRPIVNDSFQLHIQEGRHPVVDSLMKDQIFVPNDTLLDNEENLMAIITGPNMAGKSTYIRQIALITIMAQIGSFVPAKKAVIGIVDRIFTRIGAADDLSRGQSTFMVEMIETANILNNATNRSLVILDEIGRGTSTFDGLSLAWSIAEFILQETNSRSLFATHYHELVELKMIRSGVQNYN